MRNTKGPEANRLFSETYLKSVLHLEPREKIGQNFLVDPIVVSEFVARTIPGAEVLEIGSGPGNLTREIAKRGAGRVIGLEIDPGFANSHQRLLSDVPNAEVRQQDALRFKLDKWLRANPEAQHQVMGNIPFHISEPLITQLAEKGRHLDDVTLFVGDKLAVTMATENPDSPDYSKISFVASVFNVKIVRRVSKTSFWPQPRTESAVVGMTRREMVDGRSQTAFGLTRAIVESSEQNLTLAKVIGNFGQNTPVSGKVLDKRHSHKHERRYSSRELKDLTGDLNDMPIVRRKDPERVSELIASKSQNSTSNLSVRLGLPNQILSKPFSRLSNEEVRQLAKAINKL